MTDLDIAYPAHRCIPIDPPAAEHAAWARETAQVFGADTGLDASGVERVAAALTDLARLADPVSRLLLIVTPDAAVLAPLRITVSAEPLDHAAQADFLWSTDAILPPTAEVIDSDDLGAGITVALLQQQGEIQFATRRWLFPGQNAAVGALLGPVPPYGLALVQEIADPIIEQMRVDGFVPTADRAALERFEAATVRGGEGWAP